MVTVSVTDATASPEPTAAATQSTPAPLGVKYPHQPQWDAFAGQVMTVYNVSAYSYDLYQIQANTAWEDTLAYYTTQADASGWGAAPSQVSEMAGGHYAVWTVAGSDGKTNYFVVAQTESEGSYTLNIFGTR
jgi:hypothetical protein